MRISVVYVCVCMYVCVCVCRCVCMVVYFLLGWVWCVWHVCVRACVSVRVCVRL